MKQHRKTITIIACIFAMFVGAGAIAALIPSAPLLKNNFTKSTIDIGIVVSDLDASTEFYSKVLGLIELPSFDVAKETAGDSGLTDYKEFRVRQFTLENEENATRIKLMSFPDDEVKKVDNTYINSSLGLSYITIFVDNTKDAVRRARSAQILPVKEPCQIGTSNTYITLFKDPDGNIIELVGPNR